MDRPTKRFRAEHHLRLGVLFGDNPKEKHHARFFVNVTLKPDEPFFPLIARSYSDRGESFYGYMTGENTEGSQ